MCASRNTGVAFIASIAVAVSLVTAAWPGSASAQSGDSEILAREVERLGAQVGALTRRLERTRAVVRRHTSRLARLERQAGEGGETPGTRLRSRDGRFSVELSNEGLRLRGPSASVFVGTTALTLTSGIGSTLQLAPARTTLTAPQVVFGGGANCPPLARLGDAVQIQTPGELPRGTIVGSSTGVFAC